MLNTILDSLAIPTYQVVFVVSSSLLLIGLIEIIFVQKLARRLLVRLKMETTTLSYIRRPIYLQIFVWSAAWSIRKLAPDSSIGTMVIQSMYCATFLFWALTISQVGTRFLLRLSKMEHYAKFIDEQTVGVFLIGFRMLAWSLGIYLCFSAWGIDLTGWLASAGVIGVVLGFAAKDTLANLVAGLAILADRSYQVGDFIEVEGTYRGKVTRIGMRATVISSVRDVQIAIPNSLLSNGYVVNETAGLSNSHRIDVPVSVAYGTDLKIATETLERCLQDLPYIVPTKPNRILVSELAESGITFRVMVWLDSPANRELLIDGVLRRAYDALHDAEISIPFNQLDVHIKS